LWRLRKRNAFLAPFFVLALDILRQERDLGRASDEAVFVRAGFGGDKHENGGSVRRANGEPRVAGRQRGVERQLEAELIQVKAQASLLIVDENGHGGEADVEILAVRMKAAPVRLMTVTMAMASCRRTHVRHYSRSPVIWGKIENVGAPTIFGGGTPPCFCGCRGRKGVTDGERGRRGSIGLTAKMEI
jgi:hypothetical protein